MFTDLKFCIVLLVSPLFLNLEELLEELLDELLDEELLVMYFVYWVVYYQSSFLEM